MKEKEQWKPLMYRTINLGDRYLISSYGHLFSIRTKRILKLFRNKSGYYQTSLSLGSRKAKKVIKIHIAVAENFVKNQKPNTVVNHKNGDKCDNYYGNLEWVTQRENIIHSIKIGCLKNNKPVICENTGQVFNSIREASVWCGLNKKGTAISEYFKNTDQKFCGRHPITGKPLTWKLVKQTGE